MKIINCGYVTYLITAHHVATIVYEVNNAQPAATIYYDGQLGETIEAENGQTMRYAIMCALLNSVERILVSLKRA